MAPLDTRLAAAPLHDVIAAAEAIGSGRGLPVVIALYTGWIAAQAPGARDLHAAWFNLGTELGHAGEAAAAMQAYRKVLAINPGFVPAAINLGLQLERHGEPRRRFRFGGRRCSPTSPASRC